MKKMISIVLLFVALLAIGCSKEKKSEPKKMPAAATKITDTAKTNPTTTVKNPALTKPETLNKEDMNIVGIYYGQLITEIFTKYGQPVKKQTGAPKGMIYSFISNGTEFTVCADSKGNDGTVKFMCIEGNTGLATKKGIKVGSTVDDVIKAYGKPSDDRTGKELTPYGAIRSIDYIKYPSKDFYMQLSFAFDKNNKVVRISFGSEYLGI